MKQTVSIIGAGTMGSGIAQIAASKGWNTIIYDINPDTLEISKTKLEKILNRLIEKGRIDKQIKSLIQKHITYTTDLSSIKPSNLVIEAIVEDLSIKTKLFESIDEIVDSNCIIASNTSSLSITALANSLKDPRRFVGMHFFNPAPLMKLVEIVPALQTHPDVVRKAMEIGSDWDKIVVRAKDTPGFIVNKVARPFYSESIRMYEEGMATPAEIDSSLKEVGGFRMGPFELTDFIGHDVNYKVTETVWKSFFNDGRYTPSFTQQQLVLAGYLGRKSGQGFYSYPNENQPVKVNLDKATAIVNRVIIMLINEAADTVHRQIASVEDIDTAMTKGVNYPKGLLKWADELGIEECVRRMDILFDEYHEERYRCSPLLRKMVRKGQKFYEA